MRRAWTDRNRKDTQCAAQSAKRSSEVDLFDKDLQELVAKGKSQGYLTYDEVNDYLPDEEVNPDKLDNLLIALEEQGIDLVNEPPPKEFYDVAEQAEHGSSRRPGGWRSTRRPAEAPLPLAAEVAKWSNDPIRLYLSQMAEIPLLGPGRGNLAGQEDRGHPQALPPHGDRLQPGDAEHAWPCSTRSISGSLPFDRTIKVSLTERLTKEQIIGPHAAQPGDAHAPVGGEPAGLQPADSSPATSADLRGGGPQAVHPPPPQDAHAGRGASLRTRRVQAMMRQMEDIAEPHGRTSAARLRSLLATARPRRTSGPTSAASSAT